MKLKELIDRLAIEVDYIDDSFEDEIEIFLIPLRQELQNHPKAMDLIVEYDKKIVEAYEKDVKSKYLKMILTPIYELAKKNIEAHKSAA